MTEIELEVSKSTAEEVVEQLEQKGQRIENVAQSFRSNNLTDCEAYEKLLSEQRDIDSRIENIEEQIDEQETDGLGELFG